jgi:hypothetical protein
MKKKRIIIVSCGIVYTILVVILSLTISRLFLKTEPLQNINHIKGDGIVEEFKVTDSINNITKNVFEEGCIRDEQSAAKIADIIFKVVCGENYNTYELPLLVYFDDIKQEWLIKTQLPDNKDIVGSSIYIIIKKSNAEVVAIWADA